MKKHRLLEIDWPDFGASGDIPKIPPEEFRTRIAASQAKMERLGLSHLVVYGDREHFANLAYLTGFDPRFEEALLVLSKERSPLILVGNECEAYLNVSPLFRNGEMRSERFQSFSLIDQSRSPHPP